MTTHTTENLMKALQSLRIEAEHYLTTGRGKQCLESAINRTKGIEVRDYLEVGKAYKVNNTAQFRVLRLLEESVEVIGYPQRSWDVPQLLTYGNSFVPLGES